MALSTQPSLKTVPSGNSPVVQWLGFHTFIAEARIQSMVWEIRSSKLLSAVRKKKKKRPLLYVKLFSAYIVFSYGLSSLIKPQRGRAECYHCPHMICKLRLKENTPTEAQEFGLELQIWNRASP